MTTEPSLLPPPGSARPDVPPPPTQYAAPQHAAPQLPENSLLAAPSVHYSDPSLRAALEVAMPPRRKRRFGRSVSRIAKLVLVLSCLLGAGLLIRRLALGPPPVKVPTAVITPLPLPPRNGNPTGPVQVTAGQLTFWLPSRPTQRTIVVAEVGNDSAGTEFDAPDGAGHISVKAIWLRNTPNARKWVSICADFANEGVREGSRQILSKVQRPVDYGYALDLVTVDSGVATRSRCLVDGHIAAMVSGPMKDRAVDIDLNATADSVTLPRR